jgi:hypothetical protein
MRHIAASRRRAIPLPQPVAGVLGRAPLPAFSARLNLPTSPRCLPQLNGLQPRLSYSCRPRLRSAESPRGRPSPLTQSPKDSSAAWDESIEPLMNLRAAAPQPDSCPAPHRTDLPRLSRRDRSLSDGAQAMDVCIASSQRGTQLRISPAHAASGLPGNPLPKSASEIRPRNPPLSTPGPRPQPEWPIFHAQSSSVSTKSIALRRLLLQQEDKTVFSAACEKVIWKLQSNLKLFLTLFTQ